MSVKPGRNLFWAAAILVAGAILAASPAESKAQCLSGWGGGWGMYPSWGYAVGMPGYYADFRAQSYYAAPWIAGYEGPWYGRGVYGPGGLGCGFGYGYGGAGRYPWIWNRHDGFVTRGFVTASAPASIKVFKNPYYKSGEAAPEASPSDAPKTTAVEKRDLNNSIRVVSNPHFSRS